MPLGCFYMESIFTADDLTDITADRINVRLLFTQCSKPVKATYWKWQKRNAVFFPQRGSITRENRNKNVCYCHVYFCAHTLWNKVSKLTEKCKIIICTSEFCVENIREVFWMEWKTGKKYIYIIGAVVGVLIMLMLVS